MKIGDYLLHAVLTSRFALDGGAMFGVVPKTMWARKATVDESNRIDMVTRSLLISGEGRNILVDAGNGDKFDGRFREIYRLDTDSANAARSLAEVGLAPGDITDVILTHLHFDHVGGATRIEDGKLVPTFPNARHYVQRKNFEHANHPNERDRASYLPENWEPLREGGLLELVDGPCELFPGLRLEVSDGHTPGQQLPLLSDGVRTLLYCGDLFPTSAHVPVPWIMGYDLEPLAILEEKKRVLAQAVEQKWIFFYEHDARCAATLVEQDKKGFRAAEELSF